MKQVIKLSIFLLVLGAISGIILSTLNYFTKDKIVENDENRVIEAIANTGVSDPQLLETSKTAGIDDVYTGKIDGEECYAFQVSNINSFTTVQLIVVIKTSDDTIAKISSIGLLSTHVMDKKLLNNANTVIGKNNVSDLKNLSGATYSSASIKICLETAMAQYLMIKGGN